MRCNHCGSYNDDNAAFCSKCGQRMPYTEPITPQQPVQQVTKDKRNPIAPMVLVLAVGIAVGAFLFRGGADKPQDAPEPKPESAVHQTRPGREESPAGTVSAPSQEAPSGDPVDPLEDKRREAREQMQKISAGAYHTLWIRSDGTVAHAGSSENGRGKVSGWRDIVAVSAASHSVGLCADGTVVATGGTLKCSVSGWSGIIKIDAGDNTTVGLTKDGKVVAVGKSDLGMLDVSGWREMEDIAAGADTTYGLSSDGTVRAVGSDASGQKTGVSGWRDIVAISAGTRFVAGLKRDGTVVVAGTDSYSKDDTRFWMQIIAIAAGSDHVVGLRADGTVEATGRNDKGQCDVGSWTDIVAVSAGMYHTIGLKSDGSIVVAGLGAYGPA